MPVYARAVGRQTDGAVDRSGIDIYKAEVRGELSRHRALARAAGSVYGNRIKVFHYTVSVHIELPAT